MKNSIPRKNSEGYILIKDYVSYFDNLSPRGTDWVLPMRLVDRIQISLLRLFAKYSWFSERIYVVNETGISPRLAIVINVLIRAQFIDGVHRKEIGFPGYFGFQVDKKTNIGDTSYSIPAHGIGTTEDQALSKALGEAVERIVSGLKDENKNHISASYKQLEKQNKVVYPLRVHRYLPIQKKELAKLDHTEDTEILWVEGRSLISNEKTYIPKDITSWFYGPRIAKKILIHSTTNGSAGYFLQERAVLSALLEVIERDSLFVHWLTKTPPRRVDIKSLPNHLKDRVSIFCERGYDITIFVTTTDVGIPSIHVVSTTKNSGPYHKVVLSGAANVTYEAALTKAFDEIISCSPWITQQENDTPESFDDAPFLSRIDKYGRYRLWSWNSIELSAPWMLDGDIVSYQELTETESSVLREGSSSDVLLLQNLLTVLKRNRPDIDPVVYLPKNKVAESLGFVVAQVYVEKLFPLYLIECYGTFDSDRLTEFITWKGKKNFELNSYPHPML